MKSYAESFYKSRQWQRCRDLCIQRAGGLCERCRKEGVIRAAVIAHHKKEITPQNINNPEITLNLDNLEALCMDCHAKVHHRRDKRYRIDKDGKVVGFDR